MTRERRMLLAAALLVAALAVAVHARSLGFSFLSYDDPHFILEPAVVSEPSLHAIGETFVKPVWGSYHPLHILSYALDASLWGMERPQGFHATNVALFAAVSALLVLVARSYGCSLRGAALAGVLFAVHPCHVESVAWLTGRKDVLSGVFVLLALLARARTGLALFLFLLALASKTTAAALAPFLVLDALLARRLDRREALRLLPFVLLAGFWLAIEAVAQRDVGGVKSLRTSSPLEHVRLVVESLAWYPVRFFWPHPLTPRPSLEPGALRAALILAVTLAPAVFSRRSARAAAFFFLALAPVSNVVPLANEVQDRYLFLPSLAAACVLGELAARRRALGPALAVLVLLGTALAAGALARETWRYSLAWSSDRALWSEAVAAEPDAALPRIGLAGALQADGRLDEALVEARRAVSLGGGALALGAEARLSEQRGDLGGAARAREAAWHSPGSDSATGAALVRVLVLANDLVHARAVLHEIEERDRDAHPGGDPDLHRARAYVAQGEKQLDRATGEYWAAESALDGDDWLTLAALERVLGRDERARTALARALRRDRALAAKLRNDSLLGPLLH